MKKDCSVCGKSKMVLEFNLDKYGRDGIRAQCKICQYEVSTKRYHLQRTKVSAKWKAKEAKKRGLLKSPVFCEQCKGEEPLDMHHPNYSEPLAVVWLCRKCHSSRHRAS